MKSRLHKIEITNFKAFREFTLNLEGRHLLVYGANGAGKSSLYWALYTFLQSARKPRNGIAKYFDPAHAEKLLNIHEQSHPTPKPGEIALTLREVATKNDTTYRISQSDHGTHNQPAILKGDLASDFITYRFFFGFSDFRNSEKFNLWPLFEEEILPFCVSTGGKVPLEAWRLIKHANPNPNYYSGLAGTDAFDTFHRNTHTFAGLLPGIVDSISAEAQKFYDRHFSAGDPAKVTLKLVVTTLPMSSGSNQPTFLFTKPVVEFGIHISGGQSSHNNMLEFCWKIFIAITIGSAVSGQQITSRIFAIGLTSLAKMSISGMPIYGILWYRFGFDIDGLGFLRPRPEPVRRCRLR